MFAAPARHDATARHDETGGPAADTPRAAPPARRTGRAARRRQLARWKKTQRRALVATAVALVGGGITLASTERGGTDRTQASTAPDLHGMGGTAGTTDDAAGIPSVSRSARPPRRRPTSAAPRHVPRPRPPRPRPVRHPHRRRRRHRGARRGTFGRAGVGLPFRQPLRGEPGHRRRSAQLRRLDDDHAPSSPPPSADDGSGSGDTSGDGGSGQGDEATQPAPSSPPPTAEQPRDPASACW
ncbi:hypothetical protein ACFQV4_01745 [Streptomyces thermocarboxydus]